MGGIKAKRMTKEFPRGGGSKKTSSLKKEDHAPKSKIKSKIKDDADEAVAKAATKEELVVMTSSADKAEIEKVSR